MGAAVTRFLVERTSGSSQERPCAEAVKGEYVHRDEFRAAAMRKNPRWLTEGTNHREVDGRAIRERVAEGWFVELGTLADFVAFVEAHECVVVQQDYGMMIIEIYDFFRE